MRHRCPFCAKVHERGDWSAPKGGHLNLYVIYAHPRDEPDYFVVRCWRTKAGAAEATAEHALADSVEEARAVLPGWADFHMGRRPDDDKTIVEVWM